MDIQNKNCLEMSEEYKHPLENCDEYMKNLYFDILFVFGMYDNGDIETIRDFIEQLMVKNEDTLTFQEHIKRALLINTDKISEVVGQAKYNHLEDILMLDILIILSYNNSEISKKQSEFLAQFSGFLGVDDVKMRFYCDFAFELLKQNFEDLKKFVKANKDFVISIEKAQCYTQPIVDRNIISTRRNAHFYSLVQKPYPEFERPLIFGGCESLIFENIVVRYSMAFHNMKHIRFIDCIFKDIPDEGAGLHFRDVNKIDIENCTFQNFREVFWFDPKTDVSISDTLFKNCNSGFSGGGIVFSNTGCNIKFNRCKFENISTSGSIGGVISVSNRITAENCEFYNCHGYCLFCFGSYSEKNNKYVNCSSIKN